MTLRPGELARLSNHVVAFEHVADDDPEIAVVCFGIGRHSYSKRVVLAELRPISQPYDDGRAPPAG